MCAIMSTASVPLRYLLGTRHLVPRRKGPRTQLPILPRIHQMPPHTKQIGNRVVNREKALDLPRRCESAHLAVLVAGELRRHFSPGVRPVDLAVRDTGQELPPRRPRAAELVRHQFMGAILQSFQYFAKEAFRRLCIPPLLYEDIQHVAILID